LNQLLNFTTQQTYAEITGHAGFYPEFSPKQTTDVLSSSTVVGTVLLRSEKAVIGVEVTNQPASDSSSNALTAFTAQIQIYPDGPWFTYLSGSDWSSSTLPILIRATSGLATLSTTTAGYADFTIEGAYALQFVATSSSKTGLQVRWTRKSHGLRRR